jgi:hypothetical protein
VEFRLSGNDPATVFLNVPFDEKYRPIFIALLASLTALGHKPRCVLEVPSSGLNRLDRIYDLLASCDASIHDLSRVTLSGSLRVPRFNMPFELGLAYAIAQEHEHYFFVLEAKPHRLQASLSDFNGHDPQIHDGTQDGVIRCVLDCFGTDSQTPSFATLKSLTLRLARFSLELQREHDLREPFHPYVFRRTVDAAAKLARSEGLIP